MTYSSLTKPMYIVLIICFLVFLVSTVHHRNPHSKKDISSAMLVSWLFGLVTGMMLMAITEQSPTLTEEQKPKVAYLTIKPQTDFTAFKECINEDDDNIACLELILERNS